MSTLHEDLCTCVKTPRRILLRMRNSSDKIYGENNNTHFMFNNIFFENRTDYETMWKI